MDGRNLSEMTLGELRELYPTIKATSKKVFLEKVAEQTVVDYEVVVTTKIEEFTEIKEVPTTVEITGDITITGNGDISAVSDNTLSVDENQVDLEDSIQEIEEEVVYGKHITPKELVPYLVSESKSNKKIIIKMPSTFDADFMFLHLKEKLLPALQEQGVMIMASSTRRDFHFNGTCYCRLVCQANYTHISGLIKYDTFKEFVNE